MGSVGTSSGRISSSTMGDLLEGRVTSTRALNTLVVFPNNTEGAESRSNDRGYAISFSGATATEKEAFLRNLKGKLNTITRNIDSSRQKAINEALKRGATEQEARIAGEIAATKVQREFLEKQLKADRESGKPRFGGIKIRNITKRDYKQHS